MPRRRNNGGNISWREAIIEVLQSARKAMHYTDIAKEIADRELRTDVGATPANSVSVVIHDSLRKEGDKSPFVKVDKGQFILRTFADSTPATIVGPTEAPDKEGAEDR